VYSSTLSITSALEGVGGYGHAPAALPPRERTLVADVQEAGLVGCRSGRAGESLIDQRGSKPGPSHPERVATLTELPRLPE
jgi:hypothetical protein